MAGPTSDYHRGDMDIQEQVSTFHLVMGITKWGSVVLAAFILFITLWFCTHTGFLGSLVSGAVVLILGIILLREKKSAGH
jgi:Bacterial aa3 type cytochrome c oxidase subunit IV